MTPDVTIDAGRPGAPFPPIHEGRYEVDPVNSGIAPVKPRLVDTVRRAGTRLLRIGVGCWLPGLDPKPKHAAKREWFVGRSAGDVDDPSAYSWAHLDANLDVARVLGCDVLLSIDYMPAALAVQREWAGIPEEIRKVIPDYTYPNGVRTAPPSDPEAFARGCMRILAHMEERGQPPRYVELWNEPDLPLFFSGDFEEYWAMYTAFARAVHEAGHRVGGPSWAHVIAPELWRDEFIARASREKVPLDFYSWHCYKDAPHKIVAAARTIRETLDAAGLQATESVLDEWGYTLGKAEFWGSVANAAFLATALVGIVDAGVTVQTGGLLIDPRIIPLFGPRFMGIARRNGDPNPVFHCLEAFEAFQRTPLRLKHDGPWDLLAGTNSSASELMVIIPNSGADDRRTTIALAGGVADVSVRRLTKRSFDKKHGWEVLTPLCVGPDGVALELPAGSLTVLEGALRRA